MVALGELDSRVEMFVGLVEVAADQVDPPRIESAYAARRGSATSRESRPASSSSAMACG